MPDLKDDATTAASASAGSLDVGRRFKGLLVQSKLGEGAMGTTYLASHAVLRTPVVIKVFKDQAPGPTFGEAHLAARVASPFVVAVLDAGVEEGTSFLVQRYVDGLDLEELAAATRAIGRALPLPVVARFVIQAARGLHAMHQAGVVHRDIKPANLFLCASGEVVVGDLGLALEPGRAIPAALVGGTPLYMAPEQWQAGAVDRRADLYSLGATAHTLATGSTPFGADTALQLREAHVSRPYVPPAARDPRSAFFFAVVERALRKNPAERYATADQLARELELIAAAPLEVHLADVRRATFGPLQVELLLGDLAETPADVIVNAANWRLTMNVGVAARLSEVAGPAVAAEAAGRGGAAMGDVVWTGAGKLPARHVAHAVAALAGSICIGRCTLRALLGADARGAESIAFPALGTGVGEVPAELCARLMLEGVRTFAGLAPGRLRSVRVVLHSEPMLERFASILSSM